MAKYLVETEGGSYHVETEDAPNPFVEGAKSLASGVEKGGLGVLQTAENIQKGITGKASKFQGVIDQANQYLPKSNLDNTVPGQVLEGVGQVPGMVTQVEGMGGGVPGMFLQGALSDKDADTHQALSQGTIQALLGSIYNRIGGIKAAPEAGQSQKIAILLSRIGLGGALGAGTALASGSNPTDITSQGILGGVMSAPSEAHTQKEIADRKLQLQEQFSKKANQVLNPPKKELAYNIEKGNEHPATEQFMKHVQPASKFEDLIAQVKNPAESSMRQRDEMLKNNNKPHNPDYMVGLQDEIDKAVERKDKPSVIEGMRRVLDREVEYYKENKGKFDNFGAENRKEYHGKQAAPLLEKVGLGKPTELTPGEMQGHELLRGGLQRQIEQANPGIEKLNQPYAGLTQASELLSNQAAAAKTATTPSTLQKVLGHLLPLFYENPALRAAVIGKELATSGESKSLKKQTSKLAKLRGSIEKL